MYQIDFEKPCKVHFIGIGGISMSGLAEILLSEGFQVSGSDMKDSELCQHLRQAGAQVQIGQRAENIQDPDLVVYTAAIHPDNPEFQAAKGKGLPMLSRAELLGELMKNYKEAVNVAGTHGKTTTTSMIAEILMKGEKDPTVTVGGILTDHPLARTAGTETLFCSEKTFTRLTGDCEQVFHCPAADLTAIRHSWLCTISDGVQDILRRGEGSKARRKQRAAEVLAWPQTAALCASLKKAGRFSPLAVAMRMHSPGLLARLWRLREEKPDLYGKLEAIGQRFARPARY